MQIKFSDVTHVYTNLAGNQTAAIKDVNLDLSGCSITAIVGHTGSGKSTAMQHINGLLQATSGEMQVGGEIISNKKNRKLATIRQHIGYVFQNPAYQLFASTILEDVMYGPLNFGMNEQAAKEAAIKALAMVGIDSTLFETYPFDLSGGQMRKVALAGALAYQPDVLILDEPTVGLDPLATKQFISLLQNLHEQEQKSLIFITHDMEFAYQVAKRMVVFADGKVVFDGTPFKLFSDAKILARYALDMPELFAIAHGLKEKGIELTMTEQEFSWETMLEALKRTKGLDKK